jgi:hypothetical protein
MQHGCISTPRLAWSSAAVDASSPNVSLPLSVSTKASAAVASCWSALNRTCPDERTPGRTRAAPDVVLTDRFCCRMIGWGALSSAHSLDRPAMSHCWTVTGCSADPVVEVSSQCRRAWLRAASGRASHLLRSCGAVIGSAVISLVLGHSLKGAEFRCCP